MSVHSDGLGATWTNITSLDVDQPLGISWRQMNHIALGLEKRIEHEHAAFADGTVGAKHLPGGCRILGIVENTTDLSTGAGDKTGIDITDGLFQGRGLIYDQTNNALWCFTGDGTVSDDPYLLTLHPDRAWNGGDVTWAGAHEFDASVCVSTAFYVDGSAEVLEKFHCFSDAEIEGDLTVDGTTVLTGTFLDGTTTFNAVAGENGPTFKVFGDWSSRSNNTTYTARTDGFVTALKTTLPFTGLKGATPSGTTRCFINQFGMDNASFTMVVKGGDTWDVSGADTVYWLPFGDNT